MQSVAVPPELGGIDELLMIAPRSTRSRDEPAAAVLVLYPQAGLLDVLPQAWYTRAAFDVGPQWIARVARDPRSHRILGEGVRLGTFELDESGRQVARWLEESS